jgi:hypothetical protein
LDQNQPRTKLNLLAYQNLSQNSIPLGIEFGTLLYARLTPCPYKYTTSMTLRSLSQPQHQAQALTTIVQIHCAPRPANLLASTARPPRSCFTTPYHKSITGRSSHHPRTMEEPPHHRLTSPLTARPRGVAVKVPHIPLIILS